MKLLTLFENLRTITILGSRSVVIGKNYEVYIMNDDKNITGRELLVKLSGNAYGESQQNFNFDKEKIVFKVSRHLYYSVQN